MLKRPRSSDMDDSSTEGSSKRAASEDPRTPSTTLDELATEAAQLDRMEITSTSSTSASARSRPSPEQQRQLIVLKFSLEPGTKVHIVKRTWWKTFREAISADEKQRQVSVDEVPPIDNTGLVDEGGRLLEPPKSNQTAVFVEPEHYELLKEWCARLSSPSVTRLRGTQVRRDRRKRRTTRHLHRSRSVGPGRTLPSYLPSLPNPRRRAESE